MTSNGLKRVALLRAFFAASVIVLLLPVSLRAQEGRAPYTPTTLEWFSLWGQARLGGVSPDHSIIISPRPPNTIRVAVAYFSRGARENARGALDHVVKELREEANFRGWHWLKIEESFQEFSSR